MSSSFGGNRGDGPSGAPTPTSATGGGGRAGASKRSKKGGSAAVADDSETDSRETKKVRTSFGTSRK